jgi:HEAT repeat protein
VARDPSDIPSLAEALVHERDARVREAIFTALARIGASESAKVVLPYLRLNDANTRTGAMDALRAMPDACHPYLPELLADPDSDVRLLACDLVRDAGGAEGPRWLCALIETEPQANVCAAAVEALGEIADTTATPCLSRCAERFPVDPFLGFAIKVVIDRLRHVSPAPRG